MNNKKYAVYGLRPDRRFVSEHDELMTAEMDARDLVQYGRYRGAEVWDRTLREGVGRPIFYVGKTLSNRTEERRWEP